MFKLIIMLENLSFVFIFFIGTVIGSFLNVVIDRLPKGEKLFIDRSKCEKCSKVLKCYDLIPIFSFIILKGKCRYCSAIIPSRLILVEILMGILSVTLYFYFYSTLSILSYIFYLIVFASFVAIFFIDLKEGIIPDSLLIIPAVLILALGFLTQDSTLLNNFLIGVYSFLFFLIIFLGTKGRGMGFGDVKFAFVIGFLLGFPNTIFAFYTAFLTGAIISIILIISGRKRFRKDTIAFGPFLVLGVFIAFFLGEKILANLQPLF